MKLYDVLYYETKTSLHTEEFQIFQSFTLICSLNITIYS